MRKCYHLGQKKVVAVDSVDLVIDRGEFVAIVGPSGSGKSTLLHLMGGLDRPDDGAVFVDGKKISAMGDEELADFRNRVVGFVFQDFYLQPYLSAAENVELPLKIRGVPRRERRALALEALEAVAMVERARHMPSQLSGGERQRVAIARALITKPRLLLADEPTGNLDSKTGAQILEIVERINTEGVTVVVVTHDAAVAARTKRRLYIVDGRVAKEER